MSFELDGYAVLPRFLGAVDVATLRGHVDAALAGPLPPGCERPHNTLVPLRFDHAAVGLVLASRPRIDALRAAVGARDLRWISGYVSVKAPRTAALWWHQDWWCWQHPVTYRPIPSGTWRRRTAAFRASGSVGRGGPGERRAFKACTERVVRISSAMLNKS